MRKRGTIPTYTTRVLEYLRACDDFRSMPMIASSLQILTTQASAALYSLREYRAVDCVVEPDGRPWWYALPPESDTRTRHLDERVPELKPRKQRRTRKNVQPASR